MASDISLSCSAAPGIDRAAARQACDEFLDYLQETLPDRSFHASDDRLPRIDLTVTRANERGIGFDLAWIAPDGATRPGVPLSTTFFDRNSDPTLRRRFFKTFLQQNPVPF
ncbi:hypothetical protein RHIZO_01741 [Rhizobiaceae bacterium]|nr:hypothetical protein RHIZO_01741 [Rhizobiaceae bacterium]